MCVGRGASRAGKGGARRGLPEVHFRSRGPAARPPTTTGGRHRDRRPSFSRPSSWRRWARRSWPGSRSASCRHPPEAGRPPDRHRGGMKGTGGRIERTSRAGVPLRAKRTVRNAPCRRKNPPRQTRASRARIDGPAGQAACLLEPDIGPGEAPGGLLHVSPGLRLVGGGHVVTNQSAHEIGSEITKQAQHRQPPDRAGRTMQVLRANELPPPVIATQRALDLERGSVDPTEKLRLTSFENARFLSGPRSRANRPRRTSSVRLRLPRSRSKTAAWTRFGRE